MPDNVSPSVYRYFPWVIQDANGYGLIDVRFLILEWPSSFLVVAFLSFWVALWAPGYWMLLKKICSLLPGVQLNESTQTRALSDPQEPPATGPDTVPNILRQSNTADEAVIKLFPLVVKLGIGLPSFAFGIIVVLAIAGAGTVIPSSLNDTANPMGSVMDIIESYYKSCYESNSPTQGCGLFADDNLYVNITDGVERPFVGDVCLLGNYSAISFDIGDLDSKFVGINSHHRPIIRRRSTCAPIVTHGYYDSTTTSFANISFHYGPTSTGNSVTYTLNRSLYYENIFSPTGYDVKTISTALKQFTPINELASRKGGDVFLAFINTFNVQYPTISTDPIFNATTEVDCPSSNRTCYENLQLPASVLGCTEFAEVCYPTTDNCYKVWDPDTFGTLNSTEGDGADEMLLTIFGLNYSDFGSTLSTRHGLLLDVTRRIVGNRMSQSLDPEQWKIEVRRLFEMSLLRAKWEMLAVVQGARASKYPSYTNILSSNHQGACRKYIFPVNGYKNINLVEFLVVLFMPLILCTEYKNTTLIEWLLVKVPDLAVVIWERAFKGVPLAMATLRRRGADLKRSFKREPKESTRANGKNGATQAEDPVQSIETGDHLST